MDKTSLERATQLSVTIRQHRIRVGLISFAQTEDGEGPEAADSLSALSIEIGAAIVPVADQEMVVLDDCLAEAREVLKALLARLDAAADGQAPSG